MSLKQSSQEAQKVIIIQNFGERKPRQRWTRKSAAAAPVIHSKRRRQRDSLVEARALTRRSKTYTRPSGVEKRETDARGEISVSFGFERKGLEALHKGGRYSGPYIQHISLLVGRKKLVTDHPTDHPTIQRSHAQIVASLPLKR